MSTRLTLRRRDNFHYVMCPLVMSGSPLSRNFLYTTTKNRIGERPLTRACGTSTEDKQNAIITTLPRNKLYYLTIGSRLTLTFIPFLRKRTIAAKSSSLFCRPPFNISPRPHHNGRSITPGCASCHVYGRHKSPFSVLRGFAF